MDGKETIEISLDEYKTMIKDEIRLMMIAEYARDTLEYAGVMSPGIILRFLGEKETP